MSKIGLDLFLARHRDPRSPEKIKASVAAMQEREKKLRPLRSATIPLSRDCVANTLAYYTSLSQDEGFSLGY
jgi:hypothetical protein